MGSDRRQSLMKRIVDIEELLFGVEFPASGSLYFTDSLPNEVEAVVLPDNKSFCVGSSTEFLWWYHNRGTLKVNQRPWKSSQDVLDAVASRELEWLRCYGEPRYPREPLYREFYGKKKVDSAAQIHSLEQFLTLSPHIIPEQDTLNRPIIRHPDLSPSNIFVDEPGDITNIIDWERTAILPLFLQAKVPRHFQNFGDETSERFEVPALPENFESLFEGEKQHELELYRQRHVHYYYLGYTSSNNDDHFDAMGSHSGMMRSRLYDAVNRPWEGDNTTLKASLINASSYWSVMATGDMKNSEYPLTYSDKEVKECLDIDLKQKTANTQMQNMRNHFGVNADGWTPNDMYEEAREKAESIKVHMLEASETDGDRQDILDNWPFQDHEEID